MLDTELIVSSDTKDQALNRKEDENEMKVDAVKIRSSDHKKGGASSARNSCNVHAPASSSANKQMVQATNSAVGCGAGFAYWRRQAAFQAATFRRQ